MKLEEFGKKVKKFSRDTVAEVQRMNEVRQFNARIHEEKKLLNSVYTEIGKKLYQQYKDAPLEGFQDEFHKIEERFSAIEVYADQVRKIRGVRLCPNCNTEVSVTEKFCSNCGSKLPEIITIEDTEQEVEGLFEKEEAAGAKEENIVDAEEKDIRTEEGAEAAADAGDDQAAEDSDAKSDVTKESETDRQKEDARESEADRQKDVAEESEADAAKEAEPLAEERREQAEKETMDEDIRMEEAVEAEEAETEEAMEEPLESMETEQAFQGQPQEEAVAQAADAAGAAAAFQEQINENMEDITDKTTGA